MNLNNLISFMVLHHTVNPLCNARSIFVLSLSGSMIFYKKSSFTSSMSGEKALPGHYVTRGGSSGQNTIVVWGTVILKLAWQSIL